MHMSIWGSLENLHTKCLLIKELAQMKITPNTVQNACTYTVTLSIQVSLATGSLTV